MFGTAQPLRGMSGAIRRYAYTFSEGRTAHWLLLIVGDRVDVLESRVEALLKGSPTTRSPRPACSPSSSTRAFRTRFGQHRADLKHQPIDLLLWAAPYLAIAGGDLHARASGGRQDARCAESNAAGRQDVWRAGRGSGRSNRQRHAAGSRRRARGEEQWRLWNRLREQ